MKIYVGYADNFFKHVEEMRWT